MRLSRWPPSGKPGRVPQGVFTYALMQVLAEYPNATYGQIGQDLFSMDSTATHAAEGLRVALDRVSYWTGVGAQLSPTAARLVEPGARVFHGPGRARQTGRLASDSLLVQR